MSVYLTDPDNPQVREQLKGDYDYKMMLEEILVEMGISIYYARCAVIDLKNIWIPCFQKKFTPDATARFILADVRRAYNIPI